MDKQGDGTEIDLAHLKEVSEPLNFAGFSHEMFLTTCILSGCDYLDSIKGIGFKKAFKLVYENGGDDIGKIIRKIRREGKLLIPKDYEENYQKALLTFKF